MELKILIKSFNFDFKYPHDYYNLRFIFLIANYLLGEEIFGSIYLEQRS